MALSKKDLIRHFKIEALCGCTSKSLIRRFKKEYKLKDFIAHVSNANDTYFEADKLR